LGYFSAINRDIFAAENYVLSNIWRGGAVLWVDAGSKSAKSGLLYWIRGKEDRGKRDRYRRKAVNVGEKCRVRGSEKCRDRVRA